MTLGDPAGVGPEVVAAATAALLEERADLRLLLVGPRGVADVIAAGHGERVEALTQERFTAARGAPSAESGRAALAALMAAIAEAQSGAVEALVTAPLSKHAIAMAGSTDRGHTWILARELGVGPVAMAFLGEKLRVVLATDHVPLRQLFVDLTPARIVEVAELLAEALRRWRRLERPRLALAGLNPHAGEEGLLGNEEERWLQPAVVAARQRGLDLSSPLPADSLFRRAYDGEFDGVVALYHDQGLAPVKMLGLGSTVNVTLGLKVPRTSPDHGTAFDRVGGGGIRADGMIAALRLAAELARGRGAKGR